MPTSSPDSAEAQTLELLLPSVRQWAATLDAEAIEAAGEISPALREQAAELGLFGLTVPIDYEGAGFGVGATAQVITIIAERDRSVATSIGLHCGLGLRGLVKYGDDSLREKWLPRLARGEVLAAFCATETNAGSHIAGVQTQLQKLSTNTYQLTGSKAFVTNGGFAGVFTALARGGGTAQGGGGHSLVFIPSHGPHDIEGLQRGAEELKLGIKASSTIAVHFDSVTVTSQQILGRAQDGDGLNMAHSILSWGRTLMAAGCQGTAQAAWIKTRQHIADRQQFGHALRQFQLVKRHFAHMTTDILAISGIVRLACEAIDGHRRVDVDTTHFLSAAAKVVASERTGHVCDTALQLHGGAGFCEDVGIARLVRDARITRIFEGANDLLRLNIAGHVLKSTDAWMELCTTLGSEVPEAHKDALQRLAEDIATTTQSLKKRFGFRLLKQQVAMAALADAVCMWLSCVSGLSVLHAEQPLQSPIMDMAPENEEAYKLHLAAISVERARHSVPEALRAAECTESTEAVDSFASLMYAD